MMRRSRLQFVCIIVVVIFSAAGCSDSQPEGDHASVHHDQQGKAMSVQDDGGCMIIFGASYAKGWDVASLGPWRVVNEGIGGDETKGMLARLDADVLDRHPDVLLIWGFINDVFRAPRNEIDKRLESTRSNILEIIDLAKANGIEPVIATEITIRNEKSILNESKSLIGRLMGRPSYQDYINSHVSETNVWLRVIAATQDLALLDYEKVLADARGHRIRRYAADDGSHISQEGYSALTAYSEQRIRVYLGDGTLKKGTSDYQCNADVADGEN